jgi:hypothetical protein
MRECSGTVNRNTENPRVSPSPPEIPGTHSSLKERSEYRQPKAGFLGKSVALTRSGRERRVGRLLTGRGCLIVIALSAGLLFATVALAWRI